MHLDVVIFISHSIGYVFKKCLAKPKNSLDQNVKEFTLQSTKNLQTLIYRFRQNDKSFPIFLAKYFPAYLFNKLKSPFRFLTMVDRLIDI